MEKSKKWISNNCPLIWDTLNNRAKNSLPKGIIEFLENGANSEIENGRNIFLIIENYLDILVAKINSKDVHNAYRRELSSVNDEKQLVELFAEIAVCTTIARISSTTTLKPLSNKPKHSDFKAKISYNEIYGEVKRFEDKTKIMSRSILSDDNYKSKQKTTRPRFLELYSKLENVYEQLSKDRTNILFLFHSSIGETIKYVKQVLFGESNFWNDNENLVLDSNSLFAKKEWENISAVCLCKLGVNKFVNFYEIFINPNAIKTISNKDLEKLGICA